MMREEEWIEAARQGDQDAFAELVRLYEKRVFALTSRMWGEASFSTWLYRLASNACVDLLRREGRHRAAAGASLDDEEMKIDAVDPAPSPQDVAERRELREQVEAGLAALSPEHRQVLVLREIHQLSYDEISQVLSLDVGTVKSRISRGRRQLRKFLLESGNFSGAAASKETEKEGCK